MSEFTHHTFIRTDSLVIESDTTPHFQKFVITQFTLVPTPILRLKPISSIRVAPPALLVRELLLPRHMLSGTMKRLLNHKHKESHIMLWTIAVLGTYVVGIYFIRLVWWQE